ncbi:hypothetical protein ACLBXJ_15615 [Methylobacterium mesophilicum]
MGVRTLTGYDRNARTHSDAQVAQLAAAIDRFGFELRQKRRERVIFYIGNAGVSPTDGKTETVTA